MFGDVDQAAGGIVPFITLFLRAFVDGIAGLRLDRIRNPMGRQALDLFAVVALRDQPGFRPQHVVKAVIRVADRARIAGDAELLRRHAFHARALTGARGPHGDVMEERMADSGGRIGMGFFATRDFAIRWPPLRMRDDLDPGVRGNDGERRIIEIVIGLALMLLARLPPHLDDADLRQQRVLDEGIQHDKAGILLHEDVIDVIRLLLGGGNILRPDRLEPNHLVARREDVHQRRHQPFHRVGDIGRHRLRPAVRRRHVARHVAEVVVERGGALLRQLGRRHRGQGIGLLRGEQRAQIGIGHFRHGGSGLQLHGTQRRASDASKGLSGQLLRGCSPSRHARAATPSGVSQGAAQSAPLARCTADLGTVPVWRLQRAPPRYSSSAAPLLR